MPTEDPARTTEVVRRALLDLLIAKRTESFSAVIEAPLRMPR
jgi:hypothetical protein